MQVFPGLREHAKEADLNTNPNPKGAREKSEP